MAVLDNPIGALTALDSDLSDGLRHTASPLHTHDFRQPSSCGTCRVLSGRDPADITLRNLGSLRDDIKAVGQLPCLFSSLGGTYEEGTWCKYRDSVAAEDRAYIDLAWAMVVDNLDLIEDYFSSRDEDWRCYQDALTGSDKVRLDVDSMDGFRGKGWGDIGRGGSVIINQDLLVCERHLMANSHYTISERACVLLDMSALIVHEVRHTCWINEAGAYSVEGWFRYNIQQRLGISADKFCGQTSWRCGTSTSSADGCKDRDTLRGEVINIKNASGSCDV